MEWIHQSSDEMRFVVGVKRFEQLFEIPSQITRVRNEVPRVNNCFSFVASDLGRGHFQPLLGKMQLVLAVSILLLKKLNLRTQTLDFQVIGLHAWERNDPALFFQKFVSLLRLDHELFRCTGEMRSKIFSSLTVIEVCGCYQEFRIG